MLRDGTELRREDHVAEAVAIEQRLLAEAIAREEQLALRAIGEREGEHAGELLE